MFKAPTRVFGARLDTQQVLVATPCPVPSVPVEGVRSGLRAGDRAMHLGAVPCVCKALGRARTSFSGSASRNGITAAGRCGHLVLT